MKKALISLLILALMVLSLTACGNGDEGSETSTAAPDTEAETENGPHEHSWGDGVVKTPAGCTTTGTVLYTCECEQTKRESIPATGHSMKMVEAIEATATTDGLKEHYVCENCEKLFIDEAFCVDPGIGMGTAAYPFGNFSGTEFYIQRLGDNKVAKMSSNAYWPTDLAMTKEYNVNDIPAGEYVMSFDVLLGADVHSDQWSFVVAMVNDGPDGRVDILNTKPTANSLGYDMLKNANAETWTTYEIPFTTTGTYTTLKAEIYLWPENYLNEPVYLDNFKIYKKDDATKTNIDTLAGDFENIETYLEVEADDVNIHLYDEGKVTKAATCNEEGVFTYTCAGCGGTREESIAMLAHPEVTLVSDGKYECNLCHASVVYDEEKALTLKKDMAKGPYANYSDNDFTIRVINGNAVGNLKVEAGWPSTTAFTKEIGTENLSKGTYVVSFDVLLGVDSIVDGYSIVAAMNINGTSTDILNTKPDANALGLNMLHDANHDTWTTYEVEFEVSEDATSAAFTLYLWAEVSNGGDIFVDNIKVYAKDDATKTNVDTLSGDFEGYAAFKEAN